MRERKAEIGALFIGDGLGVGWVAECLKSTTQRNPTDEGNVGVEARSEVRHNKLTSVLLLTENKINAESNRRCSMTLGGGTVS